MVIVAGHLMVDPTAREEYLSGCETVVDQARGAPGCLDFVIAADLLDTGRINLFERWESRDAVEAFRGSGVDDEQGRMILRASVEEYDVAGVRVLS
ncbi:putative quinol monooxygenase [Rhodococcus chondri]|uniref:Antibiotic biosynthesis monooxygenase family protein n=1 Tax=Rhodococcus chondri TaxID=3065941 RepID=A0ABU7JTB1_9NOCA|nr:antibiotic biosynthesis monooxygenase family protein [Rhodococcus sp. CC-R104]MEE2033263.1 antibiotic biosynthesis monooxygenase family protein [Rhodococcus sp. CC-R104]